MNYGVIVPRLQQLYQWSSHELAAPGLLDFICDGAMTYAWSLEDRYVWQQPKSLVVHMTRHALPAERRPGCLPTTAPRTEWAVTGETGAQVSVG